MRAKETHTLYMTITTRLGGLGGWSIRCASVVVMLVFCASAFGDPSKNVVLPKQQPAQKRAQKICYTYISGSGIAQPCDRLTTIPTTAYPMDRIGGAQATK
ncbi:MAG: hypothetical protein M3R29_05220 [Verrucomicrobiota bacterium]|nr:hypothetical protein [Verrucomicrobiota bacterium]